MSARLPGPQRRDSIVQAASGLFDASGDIELVREDVGRHNALDKALGACAAAQPADSGPSEPAVPAGWARAS